MSIPASQPATTPIPVQLSENEFTAFILPHLQTVKEMRVFLRRLHKSGEADT